MSTWGARMLAVALGLCVAFALALTLWFQREQGGTVEMVDRSAELAELRALRSSDPAADLGSRRLPRRLLSREFATRLFPADRETLVYDPLPFYRRRAFLREARPWAEHPDRRFFMVTNSLGLRMDREVSRRPPDLRLLVVGDSHTDGVCNNDESYTSVAEARLKELLPGRSVEGLNAGTGGYSFYNYLGQLERLLEFEPDVFVVGVYGGNDFYEHLAPWHFFRGDELPLMSPAGWKRVQTVKGYWQPALPQAYVPLRYFHEHPGELAVALQASLAAMAEIADLCAREEIALVCLYIPALSEVQPWLQEEQMLRAREELELDAEAASAVDRLATRFLDELRARGVEVLDMRPIFRDTSEAMYWKADHHISIAGQRVTGRALADVVARMRS